MGIQIAEETKENRVKQPNLWNTHRSPSDTIDICKWRYLSEDVHLMYIIMHTTCTIKKKKSHVHFN